MDVSAPVMWAKMELLLPTLNESQLRDIFLDQRLLDIQRDVKSQLFLTWEGHSRFMGDYILPT